ncbi:helix-turn-helix domain-containing protein [Microcoleus sp. PH2017_05_CCC_O_A]|uniref:helix-turn-helix domain-containing protein n=1 Tax=Microcoleus sp. PH2017_05_CCC_O_A TaxID=2798816 RepID=UPI001D6B1F60|nr:helix-turn-helix domain-containing protein [Microcoleus sp. PH2017_05_CCC_O_A]MCC3434379.1 helix-turn-helix domain-containing protein [Microcoleus sp. PH2017_05_CCC_O_A]
MALLMPKTLKLSDDERHQLHQLSKKHNTPQQIVLRAKIILMASDGQNHREIARSLGINRQMAREGAKPMVGERGKRLIDFAKITRSRACWRTSKI